MCEPVVSNVRYWVSFGWLMAAMVLGGAAQAAPLPNLVLACPTAGAVGQTGLDSCRGYVYQIPTNDRIVATGSAISHYWSVASYLHPADTMLCGSTVTAGSHCSPWIP